MIENILHIIFSTSFLYSAIRMATPILFAGLATLISNKADASNIGIEGMMMVSALVGVIFSAYLNNAFLGLLFSLVLGILLGLLLGFLAFEMEIDIVFAGIAINILGSGGTVFLLYIASGDRGYSTHLASKALPNVEIPLITNIPVIKDIFSGHNILVYFAFLMVIVIHIILNKTTIGLRIRAVGNNAHATKSVGINPKKMKYIALGMSGLLAGFGGSFMSLSYMNGFNTNMVAGRGFIGIAAEALGRGNSFGVLLSSLLFGVSNALVNHIQGTGVSMQLIQVIPYLTVVISVVIYSIAKTKKFNG